MFVSNMDVDRSNKCFFCKVKVSGCLSSNCWLFAGQKVVLAQSWIGIGNDQLINSIQWWTRSSQETATSKCLTLLGGVGKYMFVVVVKNGLTAQSLCHQGSIAINCSEPELSQVSQPYHIWIHIGLNLYNDIHQLCLIWRDLPEVSLETLIIW